MRTKSFLKSKTLWFNFLSIAGLAAVALPNLQWVKANPDASVWIGIAGAAVNFLLRPMSESKLSA